ncbi:MAG: hypothetical protein CMH54_08000 [Myxococcales bacterium]|nr:hypothetical protein [Myxococcales bacterium]
MFFTNVSAGIGADAPDRNWRSIQQGQVRVLFDAVDEELARRVLPSVQRATRTIESTFGWRFHQELTIVLTDHVDVANGSARIYPYPIITLYAHPPALDSALAGPGLWLDRLIQHELVHVAHLIRSGGIYTFLNGVLGPQFFPNQLVPEWFVEGLATMVESTEPDGGRLHHPRYQGRRRITWLEGPDFTIDRITSSPVYPPGGSTSYMFGSAFLDYLAKQTGGTRTLAAFIDEYGSRLIPYRFNSALKKAAKKDFVSSYRMFRRAEIRSAKKHRAGRELHEGTIWSGPTAFLGSLEYVPASRSIAYLESSGHEQGEVKMRSLDTGRLLWRQRCEGGCSGVSVTADGRTALVSLRNPTDVVRVVGDLVGYDTSSGQAGQWWTDGARLSRPDAHRYPDKPVLAIQTRSGTTSIVTVDGPGAPVKVLVQGDLDHRLDMPRWANRSAMMAYVSADVDGSALILLDSQTGRRTTVLRSRWPIIFPRFSDDDSSIFVTAVVDGVYETIELRNEGTRPALRLWTRSIGGIGQGIPVASRGVWVMAMRGQGWSLNQVASPVAAWQDYDLPEPSTVELPEAAQNDTSGAVQVGDPPLLWLARPRAILPDFWAAVGVNPVIGVSTFGMDPLGHHFWTVAVDRTLVDSDGATNVTAGYTYGGGQADIGFIIADGEIQQSWFDGWESQQTSTHFRFLRASLVRRLPGILHTNALVAHLDLVDAAGQTQPLRPDPGSTTPVWIRQSAYPVVGLEFSHSGRRTTRYGTVPEYGVSSVVGIRYEPAVSVGEFDRWRLSWSFRYPQVFSHRYHIVLTHHLNGRLSFASADQTEFFAVGGIDMTTPFRSLIMGEVLGYEALRGFPLNSLGGPHLQKWLLDLSMGNIDVFRGIKTLPLTLRRLVPVLFADLAWTGPYRLSRQDFHMGVGAELRLELDAGYGLRPILRMGTAYGLGNQGELQGYIVLGVHP